MGPRLSKIEKIPQHYGFCSNSRWHQVIMIGGGRHLALTIPLKKKGNLSKYTERIFSLCPFSTFTEEEAGQTGVRKQPMLPGILRLFNAEVCDCGEMQSS